MPIEIVGEGRPEAASVVNPKLERPHRASELQRRPVEIGDPGPEWRLFSTAPMHVHAAVDEGLFNRFAAEEKEGKPRAVKFQMFKFGSPIVEHCDQWGDLLMVMDSESYRWFCLWMMEQNSIDRVRQTFYVTRKYPARIWDPFSGGRASSEPVTIEVFAPSTMSSCLRPQSGLVKTKKGLVVVPMVPTRSVQLRSFAAEIDVIQLGRQLLNLTARY